MRNWMVMIGWLQRENSNNELKSAVNSRLKSDLIKDIDFSKWKPPFLRSSYSLGKRNCCLFRHLSSASASLILTGRRRAIRFLRSFRLFECINIPCLWVPKAKGANQYTKIAMLLLSSIMSALGLESFWALFENKIESTPILWPNRRQTSNNKS